MASTSLTFNPPYPDVFAEGTAPLTDPSKKVILTSTWEDVHKFEFPSRLVKYLDSINFD